MENFYLWFEETTGLSSSIIANLIKSILVIIGFIILNRITSRIVFKKTEDVFYRYRWRKTQDYITFLIGLFIISAIWIEEFRSLITFFGLVSAGIAIALKDPLTDLAGWLFILWRKPFRCGRSNPIRRTCRRCH